MFPFTIFVHQGDPQLVLGPGVAQVQAQDKNKHPTNCQYNNSGTESLLVLVPGLGQVSLYYWMMYRVRFINWRSRFPRMLNCTNIYTVKKGCENRIFGFPQKYHVKTTQDTTQMTFQGLPSKIRPCQIEKISKNLKKISNFLNFF